MTGLGDRDRRRPRDRVDAPSPDRPPIEPHAGAASVEPDAAANQFHEPYDRKSAPWPVWSPRRFAGFLFASPLWPLRAIVEFQRRASPSCDRPQMNEIRLRFSARLHL